MSVLDDDALSDVDATLSVGVALAAGEPVLVVGSGCAVAGAVCARAGAATATHKGASPKASLINRFSSDH
jgi:hypothetical protein